MEIYDAHHHLWDLGHCSYPWLMAKGERRFFGDPTPIQRNYLTADLLADAQGWHLIGSTHIQVGVAPGEEVRETAWVSALADQSAVPTAHVAFCDLSASNAQQVLAEHCEHSALRGIRQIVGREREEDRQHNSHQLLHDSLWLENLASLSALNLSFDLQLIPELHRRAAAVLADTDSLKVAVCHAGSPWDQSDRGLAAWLEGLHALAERPNTWCKLSGLGMFHPQGNLEDWRPLFNGVLQAFGTDRVMCGSNFPVDKLYLSYEEIWRRFSALTEPLGVEVQNKLLRDNARRFYRV